MADLSVVIPMMVAVGMVFVMIIGCAVLLKSFYKKVEPGEVLILNTLATEPVVVRNGTLIYPVIHSASKISLQALPIELRSELTKKINDLYDINVESITVQVIDSDESILKAHNRTSTNDIDEQKRQLSSIVNEATAEATKSMSEFRDFKDKLSMCLLKIGYEIVV